VTWQQAEDFCRRFRNGHLATIETLDEQNFVTSILPSDSDLQSWIGLRQNGAQNKWEWADGRPLTSTFNFWYSDKENHETDQPDCVAVDVLRGRWIPQSCQQAWGWVCEIPKGVYTADQLIENFPAAIEPNGKLFFR
jgi:Lectin C-type domain